MWLPIVTLVLVPRPRFVYPQSVISYILYILKLTHLLTYLPTVRVPLTVHPYT